MLYSKKRSIEDQVVELLVQAPKTIKQIHTGLGGDETLTMRAVYKAIHKLREAGVVLKAGKIFVVDQEWAGRVTETLSLAATPLLGAGERAAYTFTSIDHLDSFWITIMLPLERAASTPESFFYNPHNFWAYLPSRKESEDAYYRHFADSKYYGFFTVGDASEADKEFKRAYQSDQLQIDLRHIPLLRRTDHLTVLGPFVITVRLGKKMAEKIDHIYASGREIKDILPEIVHICNSPGKIRFIIENNTTKAASLRKILAKNFYFKTND